MKHVHQFSVDGLVVFDGFDKRHIHNLIVINANHHVTLTFEQCLDAGYSHAAGNDAVVCSRTSSALQVSQDGDTHIVLGIFVLIP